MNILDIDTSVQGSSATRELTEEIVARVKASRLFAEHRQAALRSAYACPGLARGLGPAAC